MVGVDHDRRTTRSVISWTSGLGTEAARRGATAPDRCRRSCVTPPTGRSASSGSTSTAIESTTSSCRIVIPSTPNLGLYLAAGSRRRSPFSRLVPSSSDLHGLGICAVLARWRYERDRRNGGSRPRRRRRGRSTVPPHRQHHRRGAHAVRSGVRRRGHQGRHLLLRLRTAALPGVPRDLRRRPEEDAAPHPAGRGPVAVRRGRPQAVRAAPGLRVRDAVPARRARRRAGRRPLRLLPGAEDGVRQGPRRRDQEAGRRQDERSSTTPGSP